MNANITIILNRKPDMKKERAPVRGPLRIIRFTLLRQRQEAEP